MANSTQKYLDISEIKDNVVVMKDGSLRAVILVSSINFALKGEDEQNALISGYMEFLNTLDDTMQIVIQSRQLNIDGYIRQLKEAEKNQTNELLKIQIGSYIEFIQELIELGEIMTKRFYIVVPYNPFGKKATSFFARFRQLFVSGKLIKLQRERFENYKEELELTVNNIISSLNSMGISSAILDTQSLIELYYNVYNPKTSQNQRLKDISQIGLENK